MPIDGFSNRSGSLNFFENLGVPLQNAREIHHFAQTQNSRVRSVIFRYPWRTVLAPEVSRWVAGNAGGGHEEEIQGQVPAGIHQSADSRNAEDIGDLVRIQDNGGGAAGQGQTGVFRRG